MIKINGKDTPNAKGMTLCDYLLKQNYKPSLIAVEYNKKILPKTEYESCVIKEDDVIEIVGFVGGG